MAEILKNVRIFNGGADLTSASNKVEVGGEAEERDVTTFGSYDAATDRIWKEVIAGTKTGKASASGFWQAGDPGMVDDASWSSLGGVGAWTVCPRGAAVGDVAYVTQAMRGSYQLGGTQGEIAPWSAGWSGSYPIVRGLIAHPPGTARTATGVGTAVQHLAVPAGGELIAALHVLSVAGTATPTITVKIQSDDAAGFSSPTDLITFTAATARGGEAKRLAGPVTDTYYRASWTITGTTPSFLFVVSLGVSPA
ncbi:hypothetical protein O7622_01235 [Micromonospora sp. WMMD1076]|uniref:hypothetical protein n=1 Tax=Micromonospora sp. WMMD1076 TaxID=3016103 RepID=UPI00249ADBD7|nr:hypothetical protein [Micromonospora sp. WMMD1076]WFF07254.1 hypothetical protein O7622_01235 [Micromonospora sp. WMMD1076]